MEIIKIERTSSTPEVFADPEKGITIKGKSLPEDPIRFYQSTINWCKNYLQPGNEIEFRLEYFNTSTSKIIYNLMLIASEKFDQDAITINWFYEEGDEDGYEAGLLYKDELPNLKFNFYEFSELESL